ncbi:MAG: hypothetical protein RLZZ161_1010 [Bacteroidota bacterium]
MQINARLCVCALLFGLTFMHTVTAQDNRKLIIGFKASPNFTWTRIMEGSMENNGMGLGFSYGLAGDINIAKNPNYWLSTEFLVTSCPSKVNSKDTLWSDKNGKSFLNTGFTYNLQYIQVPIALKLKTNEIGNFRYWGQFGFAPAFLMQQKLKTASTPSVYGNGTQSHNPNLDANDRYDFKGTAGDYTGNGVYRDDVRKLRASLIIGAGIETKISGKTVFSAGLRFDNAFSDVFTDDNVDGRNNFLGIQLGVFF